MPPAPAVRILIAGGGTGGHIVPALAVADEVRRRNRDSQILFVGTRRGLESKLVPEAGFDIEYLNLSGFAGRGLFARLVALVQLARGLSAMKPIIRRFQPELVLGTGGYVSGPAVLAARMAGIRTIVQEQNSIPGQMNRLLARWVDEIHIAFTETRMHFRKTDRLRLSGNPTRIRQPRGGRAALVQRLGLDADRRTIFVLGGSRGARSLNRAVAEAMPRFAGRSDVQFIIQTGDEDRAMVEEAAVRAGVRAIVRSFFNQIEDAYGMADLIVCRAGAMTLAEIAQFGLPAILVPFPFAIYQHQLANARSLVEKGAAEMILDQELSGAVLADRVEALMADTTRRRGLSRNVWKLARPDASRRLANAIENLTHPVQQRRPANLVDEDAGQGGEN